MRISDWSSGVCSSDLIELAADARFRPVTDTCIGFHPWRAHRRGGRGDGIAARRGGIAKRAPAVENAERDRGRSEEHTSELQSLMRISYAAFCLKKKTLTNTQRDNHISIVTLTFALLTRLVRTNNL